MKFQKGILSGGKGGGWGEEKAQWQGMGGQGRVKDSKYWLLSFNKAEGVPAVAATWC